MCVSFGVLAEGEAVVRSVQGGVVPFLDGNEGELRGVGRVEFDRLIEGCFGAAAVRKDDRRFGELTDFDADVLGSGSLNGIDVQADRLSQDAFLGNRDDGGLGEGVPCDDGCAVAGGEDRAEALIVAARLFNDHAFGSLNGDGGVALGVGGGVEEAVDSPDRGKAPVLFASARNGNRFEVEGDGTIRARGVASLFVRTVRVGLGHCCCGGHISRRILPSAVR